MAQIQCSYVGCIQGGWLRLICWVQTRCGNNTTMKIEKNCSNSDLFHFNSIWFYFHFSSFSCIHYLAPLTTTLWNCTLRLFGFRAFKHIWVRRKKGWQVGFHDCSHFGEMAPSRLHNCHSNSVHRATQVTCATKAYLTITFTCCGISGDGELSACATTQSVGRDYSQRAVKFCGGGSQVQESSFSRWAIREK